MKNAAYLAVALSLLAFALAILHHLGLKMMSGIVNLTPEGFLNGAKVLLLFAVNFSLLELLNKK